MFIGGLLGGLEVVGEGLAAGLLLAGGGEGGVMEGGGGALAGVNPPELCCIYNSNQLVEQSGPVKPILHVQLPL